MREVRREVGVRDIEPVFLHRAALGVVEEQASVAEQVVAGGLGIVAVGDAFFQNQSALEPLGNGGGGGQTAMIGLHRPAGNQGVGPLGQGVGQNELQFPGFISPLH